MIAAAVLLMLSGGAWCRTCRWMCFPSSRLRISKSKRSSGTLRRGGGDAHHVPPENALIGTPGLETLRSKSVLGLSSIRMLLHENVDLYQARQLVQERLAVESPRLPAVARPPVILQPLSSLSRMMKIGIWSDKLSQREMSELAVWTIRPRLMAIPGVANVAIWGQRDKQLQVLVDVDRLQAHQVTLDAVLRAAGDAVVLDAGGFVDTPNQRLAVRQLPPVREPEDFGRDRRRLQSGSATASGRRR